MFEDGERPMARARLQGDRTYLLRRLSDQSSKVRDLLKAIEQDERLLGNVEGWIALVDSEDERARADGSEKHSGTR